jgi:hypothetical protein
MVILLHEAKMPQGRLLPLIAAFVKYYFIKIAFHPRAGLKPAPTWQISLLSSKGRFETCPYLANFNINQSIPRTTAKRYEGQKRDGASRGVPAEGVAQDHPKSSISDAFCATVKRLA